MSKNYNQTGIGDTLERGKGGPLQRVVSGVIENRDPTDTGFIPQRGGDGVSPDDFATLRQVQALAPITDSSIRIIPGPPDTISPPVGRKCIIAGAATPGGPVQINFPVASAAQNGQRVGAILTTGNSILPAFDVTVLSPSQGIIFPGIKFIPPKSPVLIAPGGSVSGYTVWVWQYEAKLNAWTFDWNVSSAASGSWSQVLTNGNNSGASDPIVDEPQRLISATLAPTLQEGYRTGRTESFVSSGIGNTVRIGNPIWTLDVLQRSGDLVIMKTIGTVRVQASPSDVDIYTFSMDVVFTIGGPPPSFTIVQSIELTGRAALPSVSGLSIFLDSESIGSLRNIYLAINDGDQIGVEISAAAMIDIVAVPGGTPSRIELRDGGKIT